jgi:hypothetical protein
MADGMEITPDLHWDLHLSPPTATFVANLRVANLRAAAAAASGRAEGVRCDGAIGCDVLTHSPQVIRFTNRLSIRNIAPYRTIAPKLGHALSTRQWPMPPALVLFTSRRPSTIRPAMRRRK